MLFTTGPGEIENLGDIAAYKEKKILTQKMQDDLKRSNNPFEGRSLQPTGSTPTMNPQYPAGVYGAQALQGYPNSSIPTSAPQPGYPSPAPQSGYPASVPQPGYSTSAPQAGYPGPAHPSSSYQPQNPPSTAYTAPQHPPVQQNYANPHHAALQHQGGVAEPVQFYRIPIGASVVDHPEIPRLLPQQLLEEFQVPKRLLCETIEPLKPRSVRASFGVLPGSKAVSDLLPLPIGVCVSLVAERDVPEASFPNLKRMVRCTRCSAFINPFTMFHKNGTVFQCALCGVVNAVPEGYYSPTDPQTQLRVDRQSRPELIHSTVDLVCTSEFLVVPPTRPAMVLLLDCSHASVSSGLLSSSCHGALQALEKLKDDEFLHVGILAYDSSVHFLRLREGNAPEMISAPELVNDVCHTDDKFILSDVELPCPLQDLMVSVKDRFSMLRQTLLQLPMVYVKHSEAGCAFGPAINTAMTLLKETGGKIIASIASNPNLGEGAIKSRIDIFKLSKQPKEHTVCQPTMEWYKNRALSCSASKISVDLFVATPAVSELGTIAPLVRFTGGHLYGVSSTSLAGLSPTVERCFTRFTGFDATLRLRCSPGVQMTNYSGHFHVRESDLLVMPVVDEDSAIAVELSLTPQFKGSFAYLQFAVIFTTRKRERRIRVHTIQFQVKNTLSPVVNSIDSIALSMLLARNAVESAFTTSFEKVQEALTKRLTDALRNIQVQLNLQGVSRSPSELFVPDSMRYVPQLIAAFLRYTAIGFPLDQPIHPAQRLVSMGMIVSAQPEAVIASMMGWFYTLYHPSAPIPELPAFMLSSHVHLNSSTVVLIHTGGGLVVWVGAKVGRQVVDGLHLRIPQSFDNQGAQDAKQLEPVYSRFLEITSVLSELNAPSYTLGIEETPEGNAVYEESIKRYTVETTYGGLMSYTDYLRLLWKNSAPISKN